MMRWTRRAGALGAAVFLAAIGFGCGGSNDAAPAGDLTGLIETDRFEVPAGQTQTVTGDTTVRSTGDIVIDGDLQLADGAALALIADGELVVAGDVTAPEDDESATRGRQGANSTIVLSGETVTLGDRIDPAPVTLRAGRDGDVLVATSADAALAIFNCRIFAGPGSTGTTADDPGTETGAKPGGDIEIATEIANLAARGKGATGLGKPASIEIRAASQLRAGRGGNGFSDSLGERQGRNLALSAGDGAPGGAVGFSTATLAIGQSLVSGGDDNATNVVEGGAGGAGGDVSGAASPGGGAAPGPGGDVDFTTGNGGQGGDLFRDGGLVLGGLATQTFRKGDGGRAGDANVTAGDGGPGFAGGVVRGTVGAGGRSGTGGFGGVGGGVDDGRDSRVVLAGGRGGPSDTAERPGGPGGFVQLTNRAGGAAEGTLTVTDSFNGGLGFTNCPFDPFESNHAGSDGGGVLVIPGTQNTSLDDGAMTEVLTNSFGGGDGGDGNPPGGGGRGGFNDAVAQIGTNGNNGVPCPPDDGGGGDQGGTVVEQEPNSDCATATLMGNATTGLGQGNGGSDDDAFKKNGLTIGKYRVTTTVAMNMDIVAGEFQSLNFPVTENGFADVSIRGTPAMICFRIGRLAPDETYSFTITKVSDDPDANAPPP